MNAFFLFLSSCRTNFPIPEDIFLDEWWKFTDIRVDNEERISTIQENTCFMMTSKNEVYVLTIDNVLVGPYLWEKTPSNAYKIEDVGTFTIQLLEDDPEYVWSIELSTLLFNAESIAVLCDRNKDIFAISGML